MKNDAHINTGDVLHCQGSRFISKLIRLVTKSRFSHTAIAVRLEGVLYIADSQRDGTHLRPFNDWEEKYKYQYEIHKINMHVRVGYQKEIKVKILDEIGTKKYDYASLLYYYPRYIITGKWKGKKLRTASDKFYCSEFVAYCLDFDYWYRTSPQDLYELMAVDARFKLYLPMGKVLKR